MMLIHSRLIHLLTINFLFCLLPSFAAQAGDLDPSVQMDTQGMTVLPPTAEYARMSVRLVGPNDVDIVKKWMDAGEVLTWSSAGAADGYYQYEVGVVVAVELEGDDLKGEEVDYRLKGRASGGFQVKDGVLVTNQSSLPPLWLRGLAGLLDWMVPEAHAGGPVFSEGIAVDTVQPWYKLNDSNETESEWFMSADFYLNEGFAINWADLSPSGSGVPFKIETLSIDNLLVLGVDEVGIGTSSPHADLDVRDSDSNGAAILRLEDGSGVVYEIQGGDAGDLDFEIVANPGGPIGIPLIIKDQNGFIGVWNSNPQEVVDVAQDGAARFQLSSFSSIASDAAQYIQRRARGTQAAPASVQSGDNIGLFSFRGMRPNGLFSGSKAAITVQATQNWQNSQNGTSIKFGTTQNGTSTLSTVMEITHDKKVKINGTTLNVPDYVFEEEYDLMPLDELEAFIQEHKHLPNVASAEQVKREGVDIGGSQMALLEKIEELTLYTLRQEARIEAQQAEISELRRIEDQMIELRILVNRLVANDQLTAVN